MRLACTFFLVISCSFLSSSSSISPGCRWLFAVAGELRAEPKNVLLQGFEQGALFLFSDGADAQAQHGVQFIQGAVGFDARMRLADPLAGKE